MITHMQMDELRIYSSMSKGWLLKLASAYDAAGMQNVGDVYREWAQMVTMSVFDVERVYQEQAEAQAS